jgi:hypothetical protein
MVDFVRSTGRIVSDNFTRPNDTNPYAAGDVVCNSTSAPVIMTFTRATIGRLGQSIVQSATLIDSANVATKPDLELWLFDTTVGMDNDNAVFTPTDAELRTLLGVIAFAQASFKVGDATSGAGGNCVCHVPNLSLPINTTKDANKVYGVLVARNAYVPVAQERFDIRLTVLD